MKLLSEQQASDEAMVRGYHGIPDDNKLKGMSFVLLAAALASCESGSAKFNVVDREMKKRLAEDQSKINRFNIGLGACIGGIFGLVGVILGAHLKDSPPTQQTSPTAAVQQLKNSELGVKPPIGNIAPSTPSIGRPANEPAPVKNNEQPSHRP